MNYRQLSIVFVIGMSFCHLFAGTDVQNPTNNNSANEQSSVITIDVKPNSREDKFFRSLIKDIKSNRIEYKNGKIQIYATPPLDIFFLNTLCTVASIILFGTTVMAAPKIYLDNDFTVTAIFGLTILISLGMTGTSLYMLIDDIVKRSSKENPLITFGQNGISFKDGRLIPWSEIKEISQYNGGSYSSLTLTCIRQFGTETLSFSDDKDLPIAFSKMSELLYKVFEHMKQKQESLINPPSKNE